MDYANDGSLRNSLKNNFYSWYTIVDSLNDIISGLDAIYESKLVHCDLHDGNILCKGSYNFISDLGLSKPIDYLKSNNDFNHNYKIKNRTITKFIIDTNQFNR